MRLDLGSFAIVMWELQSRVLLVDSHSVIPVPLSEEQSTIVNIRPVLELLTFFCNLTTLVHFFSRSPSYFLLVAASKLSPILSSSRNAFALLCRFVDDRYAIIDLCLCVSVAVCLLRDRTYSSSACLDVRIWLIVTTKDDPSASLVTRLSQSLCSPSNRITCSCGYIILSGCDFLVGLTCAG
jgi:hypothetical protein